VSSIDIRHEQKSALAPGVSGRRLGVAVSLGATEEVKKRLKLELMRDAGVNA
jgi:hypothetical protein